MLRQCLGYKAEGTLLILEGSVPRFSPPQHQLFREPRALLFQSTPHTHRKSSRPIFKLPTSLLRVRLPQIEALAFMWEAFTPSSSRTQPLLRARIRPLNLNNTPGSPPPPRYPLIIQFSSSTALGTFCDISRSPFSQALFSAR